MMRKQRGVTMIGWICLLTPLAITLYAGIRVGPEYLNHYKVVQAMKETANQLKADETLSPDSIRSSLGKRFDIGYIDKPSIMDIKIAKGEKGWSMAADYEALVPLFGNLHLLMAFQNTVDID
jgi:Domain of unknown function (DUF4845)